MATQMMSDSMIQSQSRSQMLKDAHTSPKMLLENDQVMSTYCVSASEDQVSSVPYAEYFAYRLAEVLSTSLDLGPLQDFRVCVRHVSHQQN